MQNWDIRFIQHSPLFEVLREHRDCGNVLRGVRWPALADMQALLDAQGIVSGGGQPLRLAPPGARAGTFDDRYEVRIYRDGELQLRAQNWHDLFNFLVWLVFPLTKAAINAHHYLALLQQQADARVNRGPAQDALTLFDESGVVVASSDADLLDDVRHFAWKSLFWQRRERVEKNLRCFILGHALYEKALHPFIGITGRAVLLDVDPAFHALPLVGQLQAIDRRLARHVAEGVTFQTTRTLAPLPLLGIPGWWPDNAAESFYGNTAYFRPGRRQGRGI